MARTYSSREFSISTPSIKMAMLVAELAEERAVSKALVEALEQARQTLQECAQDTIGTPTHDLFVGEVAACDTALALYWESKQ